MSKELQNAIDKSVEDERELWIKAIKKYEAQETGNYDVLDEYLGVIESISPTESEAE